MNGFTELQIDILNAEIVNVERSLERLRKSFRFYNRTKSLTCGVEVIRSVKKLDSAMTEANVQAIIEDNKTNTIKTNWKKPREKRDPINFKLRQEYIDASTNNENGVA